MVYLLACFFIYHVLLFLCLSLSVFLSSSVSLSLSLSHFISVSLSLCLSASLSGNALLLSPNGILYDRVYCGAGCPMEHAQLLKNMLRVGGILVVPQDSEVCSSLQALFLPDTLPLPSPVFILPVA